MSGSSEIFIVMWPEAWRAIVDTLERRKVGKLAYRMIIFYNHGFLIQFIFSPPPSPLRWYQHQGPASALFHIAESHFQQGGQFQAWTKCALPLDPWTVSCVAKGPGCQRDQPWTVPGCP